MTGEDLLSFFNEHPPSFSVGLAPLFTRFVQAYKKEGSCVLVSALSGVHAMSIVMIVSIKDCAIDADAFQDGIIL